MERYTAITDQENKVFAIAKSVQEAAVQAMTSCYRLLPGEVITHIETPDGLTYEVGQIPLKLINK